MIDYEDIVKTIYIVDIIGIIFVTLFFVYQTKIIGWFGERWTKEALKKLPKEYIMFNDIMLYVDNKTYQIDHIIVSPYGVFVIETKQWNGYITGTSNDKYWIRHGRTNIRYHNPIHQNYGHVKCLEKLLNIDKSKLFNIVCIPSNATLKIKNGKELTRYRTIRKRILSKQEVIINNVEEIVDIISKNNITDKKTRKKHIKYIKENVIDNDPNECPKCGGQLVERNGKFGKFIGCSRYPKCRYKEKLKRR